MIQKLPITVTLKIHYVDGYLLQKVMVHTFGRKGADRLKQN